MLNRILLVIFFVVSCDGDNPTEEELAEQSRYDFTGAKIFLDVEDNGDGNLSVKVSVGVFDQVDNMTIALEFDYNEMEVVGFTNGDFSNLDVANSYKLGLPDSLTSFVFLNVAGSGTLFELDLKADDYEDTAILIKWETLDMTSSGESIYYYCTDSDFQNNVACINSGNYWRHNREELDIESICYIDAHPYNGEQYDAYSWRHGEFCNAFKTW